jgi:hypothetical protein
MAHSVKQDIIDFLSIKYKLPEKVIKAVINSQFEFTRLTIVTTENVDDLKNFRYPYMGLLVAKKQTLNKLYKKSNIDYGSNCNETP